MLKLYNTIQETKVCDKTNSAHAALFFLTSDIEPSSFITPNIIERVFRDRMELFNTSEDWKYKFCYGEINLALNGLAAKRGFLLVISFPTKVDVPPYKKEYLGPQFNPEFIVIAIQHFYRASGSTETLIDIFARTELKLKNIKTLRGRATLVGQSHETGAGGLAVANTLNSHGAGGLAVANTLNSHGAGGLAVANTGLARANTLSSHGAGGLAVANTLNSHGAGGLARATLIGNSNSHGIGAGGLYGNDARAGCVSVSDARTNTLSGNSHGSETGGAGFIISESLYKPIEALAEFEQSNDSILLKSLKTLKKVSNHMDIIEENLRGSFNLLMKDRQKVSKAICNIEDFFDLQVILKNESSTDFTSDIESLGNS